MRSDFWSAHSQTVRQGYSAELESYLAELSQASHATAQASGKRADYLLAAEFYEQTIETFPLDESLGDTLFLLGEVYTEAQQPESALAAYRRVTDDFPDHPNANEASYSSILALEQLGDATADAEQRAQWQTQQLDAQIAFANDFADDPRAAAVQAAAADRLFNQGDYFEAVDLATALVASNTRLPFEIDRTTLLIIGHGNMELEEFAAAEQAYSCLLYTSDAADE